MSEILTPPVIAALVNAAGSTIGKIITWIEERPEPASAESVAVIEKEYGTLRAAFTDGCVKILKAMEDGHLAHAPRIRELVYSKLKLPDNLVPDFDGELRYRLEYMRLHGVIARVGPTEYGITDFRAGVSRTRSSQTRLLQCAIWKLTTRWSGPGLSGL